MQSFKEIFLTEKKKKHEDNEEKTSKKKKPTKEVIEKPVTKEYYDEDLNMNVSIFDEKGVLTVSNGNKNEGDYGRIWFQRKIDDVMRLLNITTNYSTLEQFDGKMMDHYFNALETDVFGNSGKGTSNPTERFATVNALKKYFGFGVKKVYMKDE